MSVHLTIINKTTKKIPLRRDFLHITQSYEHYFGLTLYTSEVTLVIVSDTIMRGLNKKYRKKNVSTDVLAFSIDITNPNDVKQHQKNDTLILGDIYIAPVYSYKNHKGSPQEIIQKLFLHGLLHLIGLDHETDQEERRWKRIEQKICDTIPPKNR